MERIVPGLSRLVAPEPGETPARFPQSHLRENHRSVESQEGATSGVSTPLSRRVRRARVAEIVAADVIPLLMKAHDSETATTEPAEPRQVLPDIGEFAEFVMEQDAATVAAHVAALLDSGVSMEAIHLDLFAPAARLLGQLWAQDLAYFTDVAIGLTRLQYAMTRLGAMSFGRPPARAKLRRALLISMRGEVHHFGLFMVAGFFRRACWDAHLRPAITHDELAATICKEPYDVVGLSVSSSDQLESARAAIRLIRESAGERPPKIIIGGRCFLDHPEAGADLGADGTSDDALRAVDLANRLVGDAGRL
jgi:methanogenic corrinoid protein MtbC1